jgi:hypothetical protein
MPTFVSFIVNNLNIRLGKKIYIQVTKYVKTSTYYHNFSPFSLYFRSQSLIVVF